MKCVVETAVRVSAPADRCRSCGRAVFLGLPRGRALNSLEGMTERASQDVPAGDGAQTEIGVEGAMALVQTLDGQLDDTEREYGNMPFFVRPMIRRGFARRTGQSFAAWHQALAAVLRALEAMHRGQARHGQLEAAAGDLDLEALAEHYRTAPKRAARAMRFGGQHILERVRKSSQEREGTARALQTALNAMIASPSSGD